MAIYAAAMAAPEALTARAGVAGHDLVGWMMWDPRAIAEYKALGVPDGIGWVVAWRLASLGHANPAVAAPGLSDGLASGAATNDEGRRFRLEARTDALTVPAWDVVGANATRAFCDLIEPHHDAFVARIDATAGPRWMPAVRRAR
jgi:hypothetical protein